MLISKKTDKCQFPFFRESAPGHIRALFPLEALEMRFLPPGKGKWRSIRISEKIKRGKEITPEARQMKGLPEKPDDRPQSR